jgi:hypothetical protein
MNVSHLGVRCTPEIRDPGELTTILIFSLRSLFGELESYSYGVQVERLPSPKQKQGQHERRDCNHLSGVDDDDDHPRDFLITCQDPKSINAIRASLTMVAPPPYLESTVYRFDTYTIVQQQRQQTTRRTTEVEEVKSTDTTNA